MGEELQKPYDRFYKEGISFYNSGLALQESSERVNDEDYFFSPIVFLFRHTVELLFKALIISALLKANIIEWTDYKLPPINKKITSLHSLLSLYGSWKALDNTVYSIQTKEKIEDAEWIIERLDKFDNSSSFFRYPYGKKGERNNKHLSEEMDEYILSSMPCSLGAIVHSEGIENFSCLHRENGLDDFEYDLIELIEILIKCYNETTIIK